MKVLFWMNIGFDAHTTSEHLLSAVIEQLAASGNSVHVIQMKQNETLPNLPLKMTEAGVTTDGIVSQTPNKTNFVARYVNALKFYWHCRKVLKNNRDAEAVFLQSTNVAGFAVWLTRRYIKKAIVTFNVQDIFPYNAVFSGSVKKNSIVFKALAAVQRYGYTHSDHIITISEDMKDTLVADGTPSDKIEVIYNWSYQDQLYENIDTAPVAHMFDKSCFNVVYAGNIGVMQNVDILIEAAKLMKEHKDVWFHIIGNGVYKDKLKARAEEYGIVNISFHPMQPPELAPAIYSAADVNVIPLVKDIYRTALPSKTATCLACQKPVIFAIGKESRFGLKVIEEAKCSVVDADNPGELSETILNIKTGKTDSKAGEFFLKYCGLSKNAKRYADVITG